MEGHHPLMPEDVDLGFAFLPQFRGRGYAIEAASAVLAYGKSCLGLSRVVAILTPGNPRSARLLGKLGFQREGSARLQPDAEDLQLYAAPA